MLLRQKISFQVAAPSVNNTMAHLMDGILDYGHPFVLVEWHCKKKNLII